MDNDYIQPEKGEKGGSAREEAGGKIITGGETGPGSILA
jgi:hypothetical protein